MSERQPGPAEDPRTPGAFSGDEEIDALPVLAEEATVLRARGFAGGLEAERRPAGVMIPAVQAAAVAAGGFVAGAAVVGFVHRRQRRSSALAKGGTFGREIRRGARGGRRGGRAGELVQIVGSRSLLLDVHLLGGSGADG
jgi:hypothetical protein